MWLGGWGVGCTCSPGVMFSFNSIKEKWRETNGKRGMFYTFYRSCLVVSFYFSRVKILGEWGMCQLRGFLSTDRPWLSLLCRGLIGVLNCLYKLVAVFIVRGLWLIALAACCILVARPATCAYSTTRAPCHVCQCWLADWFHVR